MAYTKEILTLAVELATVCSETVQKSTEWKTLWFIY